MKQNCCIRLITVSFCGRLAGAHFWYISFFLMKEVTLGLIQRAFLRGSKIRHADLSRSFTN